MKETKRMAIIAVLMGAVLIQPAIAAAGDSSIDADMLKGKFMLHNGEIHTIASLKTDHHYRICVNKANHMVPLRVTHDGQETTIIPDNCSDFEAKVIHVAPGGRLKDDLILVGRFGVITTK